MARSPTRLAAAELLLAAHAAGRVAVVIGRASDFYGPGARQAVLGDGVFPAALAGRPAPAAHERGLVAVGDPFEAAVRLIAVLKEYFLWPRLLGRSVRPDRAEVRHLVEELVDEFLRAHRPSNAGRVRTDPAPPARAAAAGERGTAGRE